MIEAQVVSSEHGEYSLDIEQLRLISEESGILLDSDLKNHFMGHYITHLFPRFTKEPENNEIKEEIRYTLFKAIPDCKAKCSDQALLSQTYRDQIIELLKNPQNSMFHNMYIKGLEIFIQELKTQLEIAKQDYYEKLFIYIFLIIAAISISLITMVRLFKQLKSELELRQNLETAQDIAKIGSWKFWVKSKKTYWSKQLFQIFQIDPDISEDKHYEKYLSRIHPEDQLRLQKAIQKCIETGEEYSIEHKIVLDDGSIRWILGRGEAFVGLDGKTECLLGVAQDLTEQKKQQSLIISVLDKLKEAQATAKIGSWNYDFATQNQTWSEEHYKIFEIPYPQPQEKLHQMYRDRVHPEDLPEMDRVIQNAIAQGIGFTYDHRVVLDDGRRIKYVQGIGKVKTDLSGKPVSIYGTCQDITQRVLKEKETQFTLDSLGLGIWRFNPTTSALIWDDSMYRLFEIDANQFSGDYHAWESALTNETREKAILELELALKGEKEFNTTFEIKVKNGRTKHIGGRGQVLRSESGEPIMMYGLNWDRTKEVELKKTVEQERSKAIHNSKLASLGEMSAGVAHEINNPLAVIMGSIPLLNKYKNDPTKFDEKLAAIKKSGERIAKIVKGLSKFARTAENAPHQLSSFFLAGS
ncbi:MAG: PAS domain-containing protein, partial [Bdellovibrionales bacterium]